MLCLVATLFFKTDLTNGELKTLENERNEASVTCQLIQIRGAAFYVAKLNADVITRTFRQALTEKRKSRENSPLFRI